MQRLCAGVEGVQGGVGSSCRAGVAWPAPLGWQPVLARQPERPVRRRRCHEAACSAGAPWGGSA